MIIKFLSLFIGFSFTFYAELGPAQNKKIDKNDSVSESKSYYDLNIVCSTDKNSDECFIHREALYKKLGCHLQKEKCEVMEQERTFDDVGPTLCRYKSENCMESKGTCQSSFNSRWLDGPNSMAICVKATSPPDEAPQENPAVK